MVNTEQRKWKKFFAPSSSPPFVLYSFLWFLKRYVFIHQFLYAPLTITLTATIFSACHLLIFLLWRDFPYTVPCLCARRQNLFEIRFRQMWCRKLVVMWSLVIMYSIFDVIIIIMCNNYDVIIMNIMYSNDYVQSS